MSADDEVLNLYLTESREHLENIENDLLTIEQQGADLDDELINHVFRAIHTIKGASGFFGLHKVKDLTHVMEHLLDLMRKKEIVPDSDNITALLDGADVLKTMINNPDESNDMDITDLVNGVKAAISGEAPGTAPAETEEDDLVDVKAADGRVIFQLTPPELERALRENRGYLYLVEYDLYHDIERKGRNPMEVIFELQNLAYFIDSKLDTEAVGLLEEGVPTELKLPFYSLLSTVMEHDLICHFLELPKEQIHPINKDDLMGPSETAPEQPPVAEPLPAAAPEPEPAVEAKPEPAAVAPAPEPTAPVAKPTPPKPAPAEAAPPAAARDEADKPARRSAPEATLRVNMAIVDELMNLAGELVLVRNQLVQSVNAGQLDLIEKAAQKTDLITSELQAAIMSTRMQSVGVVLKKFHRVVRDLAKGLNKRIRLEIEGEEVELDKAIIEAIGDPLTHLVRNACDHGIETPEKRRAAGKVETGLLRLHAYHEAGQVVLDIIDDGAGVNTEKVAAKALKTGLHTQEELDRMTQRELAMLIFKPGFSTAEQVTEVSGRGVGMDVVYTNLTNLGGVIDIETNLGKGTVFRIKLPLTLAIIPSLMVKVEEETYAIPQVNMLELVRIPAAQVKSRLETIGGAPVMRLRGSLLPLVRLRDVLGISGHFRHPETGAWLPDRRERLVDRRGPERKEDSDRRSDPGGALNVAVVGAGNFQYGLVVDELLDSSEIVVKPMGKHLAACGIYAGATILGNGLAAPILDITGISRQEGLKETQPEKTDVDEKRNTDAEQFLLTMNGENDIFAIPLGLVARIETVEEDVVENVGGRPSIQYRGESLPLFALEDTANVDKRPPGPFHVVVFMIHGKEVGLAVKEIKDIIKTSLDIDTMTHKQSGVFGSAVIDGRITLFVDLFGVVAAKNPEWLQQETQETAEKTILVVEDSAFFREQIRSFMQEEGFQTLTAVDGQDALAVLAQNRVDMIVTDIEMPNMDGFGLIEAVRAKEQYDQLPIIAVTSISDNHSRKRALDLGVDEYLIKLDKQAVQTNVHQYIRQGRGAVVGQS